MEILKAGFIFVALTLLVGSVSAPSQKLDALIIQNKTTSTVFDVRLQDQVSGRVVSCSSILPGFYCSLSFSAIEHDLLVQRVNLNLGLGGEI